jgi:pyruvate/2-oxoglutarate/acetoin dehydrogenase E1 component/pyruvate/2-oxoglutarate dehydrogenase complex dihydrolipoamide acyltransferase (E2) component
VAERVAENLNRALHDLFAADANLYLLGEDVLDPYGGAFKITRGLSTRYADRVLSTPLSENGIVGVANGLALRGNSVIVEVMFGDFLLLALDQLVNFAAKSTTMFGRPVDLSVLVRCPVGGRRGYGATHSQSVHKFVVGVPDLDLWEMSPFVDATQVLTRALGRNRPAVLFEDKVLYTKRMFEHGSVDADWIYDDVGDPIWTVVRHRDAVGEPQVVLVGAGGVAHRLLDAAGTLHAQGVAAQVLVPTRLYPCDPAPVLPQVAAAGRVVVVEEGTPDGSWGGVLAHRLHSGWWDVLRAPVALVNSRASIIPSAAHLEEQVLVGADDVVTAALDLCSRAVRPAPAAAAAAAAAPVAAAPVAPPYHSESPVGTPLVVPRLNSNDGAAVLLEWLVPDGATVEAGQPVAVLETSKSVADLAAPTGGVLTAQAAAGAEYDFGQPIATIAAPDATATPTVAASAYSAAPAAATLVLSAPATPAPRPTAGLPVHTPPGRQRARSVQSAVAAAVSRSHASIPPAFASVEVPVDAALAHVALLEETEGAVLELGALLVAALASLHPRHRALFAAVDANGAAAPTSTADIAVTVDAGAGLFLPVVRAGARSLDEVADRLVALQMAAVDGEVTDHDLDTRGVGMGVSLNLTAGVDLVQPLIMPGMACMVSVGGLRQAVRVGPDGTPVVARVVTLGIAHDHRVVNGQPAMQLLRELADLLQRPADVLAA